jgi:hypothetical protein
MIAQILDPRAAWAVTMAIVAITLGVCALIGWRNERRLNSSTVEAAASVAARKMPTPQRQTRSFGNIPENMKKRRT